VTYQGCAEDGICYPPIKKDIALTATAAPVAPVAMAGAALSLSDRWAADLGQKSLLGVVGWFLLAGLALALTPCVFPMLPILSGIIVGQRQPITAARSFSLALIYVLAMATTYAAVGVAAGLAGRNLQALFQHPFVLVGFSLLFVALALSMFGFFHLQVPAFLQARVDAHSRKQANGSLFGVAAMGALSAVIVGPCVAPPLAAALLYLSHEGSPVTGGFALFALGLGMGLPLLILGASAGRLLPRAGAWMETVKYVFGVVFLGLAIWFLERLIPPAATLALWAVLLIGTAIYLGALEPLRDAASGWQRFWKGIGLALLCYGVVLIVGAASGADDPLKPLAPLAGTRQAYAAPVASFQPVKGVAQIDLALAAAQAQGKPVLIDFYADWCIECKRLERNTFADPGIQNVLRDFVLLRADLTAADAEDNALLQRFGLVGPPAVLMFTPDGTEIREHRLIGYLGPQDFSALLATAYATSP
jgi:thioredoxin:protein disulfide reductase